MPIQKNGEPILNFLFFSSVGRSSSITLKKKPILLTILVLVAFFSTYILISKFHTESSIFEHFPNHAEKGLEAYGRPIHRKLFSLYNKTYPLTKPVNTHTGCWYRIGVVSDMDQNSKVDGKTWQSIIRFAMLKYDQRFNTVVVKWEGSDDESTHMKSSFSNGGRGMELSELVIFNGRVYSVDDRTGIVYEIINQEKAVPWVILSDGNGKEIKGFKGEWMTVKNERLYVGGLGKLWTTQSGEVLHDNPQWVKSIDKEGSVRHFNWSRNYVAMQEQSGYTVPGYIIHESAVWSDIHRAWFFLPRRASFEQYDDKIDEERGTNILFKCSEDFETIEYIHIGLLDHRTRGFSSFKFIPGTNDSVIVALKSEELGEHTKSFITAFTIEGKVILRDQLFSENYKYEGIEFL